MGIGFNPRSLRRQFGCLRRKSRVLSRRREHLHARALQIRAELSTHIHRETGPQRPTHSFWSFLYEKTKLSLNPSSSWQRPTYVQWWACFSIYIYIYIYTYIFIGVNPRSSPRQSQCSKRKLQHCSHSTTSRICLVVSLLQYTYIHIYIRCSIYIHT